MKISIRCNVAIITGLFHTKITQVLVYTSITSHKAMTMSTFGLYISQVSLLEQFYQLVIYNCRNNNRLFQNMFKKRLTLLIYLVFLQPEAFVLDAARLVVLFLFLCEQTTTHFR